MGQKTQQIGQKSKAVAQKAVERKRAVFTRFPLLFTLLGSFGLVATFYGFEGVIDQLPWLSDNPVILLGTGIAILVLTGSLYKKLQ